MAQLPADFDSFFLYQGDLGRGAFGTVVQALDKTNNEPCAVKVILKSSVKPSHLRELTKEADIIASLSHPNIVHLRRVHDTDQALYIVMDLVSGGTLTSLLARRKLTDHEAAMILKGILRAVAYLHSKNIVHRDLKPDNILIPTDEDLSAVKVIDFGLSDAGPRLIYGECGTLLYAAPEQIQRRYYGKEIDIWSCGIILHMLVTGGSHPLWTEGDSADSYRSKLGELKWKLVPGISAAALSLFTRMTKSDPFQRYTPTQALAHPWILRRQSEIPLTSLEKIQRFNSECALHKLFFAVLFLSAVSLTAPRDAESCEPLKRRGRNSHPGIRLPPLSHSPVKTRERHSLNVSIIKPRPVPLAKNSRTAQH